MLRLQNNKYIKKLLESSKDIWNKDINALSMSQIEWRMENKTDIIGVACRDGLIFVNNIQLILLKKENGNYILFAPSTKKDKGIPSFLYDIIDIEEFVKRYPVQLVYEDRTNTDIYDDLYDELEKIKGKPTRGFIETRENEETIVYEIVIGKE